MYFDPAKGMCGLHKIAQDRTRSHRIAQDRTDLALDDLLNGVLLAKWSCRIAPGTSIGGRALLFSVYELTNASIQYRSVLGISVPFVFVVC